MHMDISVIIRIYKINSHYKAEIQSVFCVHKNEFDFLNRLSLFFFLLFNVLKMCLFKKVFDYYSILFRFKIIITWFP